MSCNLLLKRDLHHLVLLWICGLSCRIHRVSCLQDTSSSRIPPGLLLTLDTSHWPPKPPDLNIIEHSWDVLQLAVEKRSPPPRTPMHLWTFL
ncbi:hypothetical protein AVEN_270873-1 [Araneus ventricosus]|uniref:Tc1-like transposase DDE domain-containing protein n=1 Tax=Araneus ventricosus TaxID=182803 RepID=A0A4Y2LZ64_ARAVE|nr:hypothetical protein AVEN_270873-1 [Araneus ventricosus]